ncbi:MAG: glycine oxidase ThiO [Tepidiformaceae bacterium]
MRINGHSDLVVIGGGMVGLSVAYEAASRGLKVAVVERDRVAGGAGHAAAGMLAPASEAEACDQALTDFALDSCGRYPEFVARLERDSGLGCGYRKEGSLLVALNRDHAEEFDRLAAFQRRFGLHVELLSAAEVLDREPAVSSKAVGGLFAPDDRQVDPRRLQRALVAGIRRVGGTIVQHARVTSVDTAGDRVTGVTFMRAGEQHAFAAGSIVLAAGAWIAGLPVAAARSLPMRPIKGQILRLHGRPLVSHVLRTPEVYIVPRESGELVVGATAEDMGFDERRTAGAAFELLRESFRLLPGIAELDVSEHTVGFRPALRDALPAIGPIGPRGLFAATGHYRHGVMLSPATAMLLIDWIVSGTVSPLLVPFEPSRFAQSASPVRGGMR